MAGVIDLRETYKPEWPDTDALRAYLSQLIGEPFLFVRMSFGNELTLHFGALREARSPKLKNRTRGSYILAVRGSVWQLKSGTLPIVVEAGLEPPHLRRIYQPITTEELENRAFIQPGARVLVAEPFTARVTGGQALMLALSDGSSFVVYPTPAEHPTMDDPDTPERVPYIADWELLTPLGRYLRAGPGLMWEYAKSVKDAPPPAQPEPILPPAAPPSK